MSIRKAIYDLINDTTTNAFAIVSPQETTTPYATFFIRRNPVRTQDGIGPYEADLTLNIYGNTVASCVTLADSLFAGLEGAEGSYDTETLMICNWLSESDDYIESLDKILITQEYNLKFN